ncbi:hypothetical protein AVEN_32951-1 [Araneus ventricosus]|uniref:Uncharacterized protein n=1 Tax=Araneus ventricosus TaxID=182803 RepID=A0A4Y2INQ4_ARAVE|nr:hypothetical protein AVEN_32951-1 [Araneus ventricosus]
MFPDSAIAEKKISLGSTKIAYIATFGLAPYFYLSLLKEIRSSHFVLCFDEALNRVSQKGQTDVIIRYWPENSNRVKVRYFNSAFLTHSTAEDLYKSFCESTIEINLKNLLQISMDGPNLNLKFWRHLHSQLKEEKGFSLLNIGTCSLHIIHGAFQKGNRLSEWKLNVLFQSLYKLFKNSPARRADFIAVTETNVFPSKFCQIRWVENASVAETALEIFPPS